MRDRWVNAVIEIRVPLDLPVDASSREKLDAALAAMDRVQMPDNATATCRWEVVEDGEPHQRVNMLEDRERADA